MVKDDWKAAGAASDGKADNGKTMMGLLMVQFGDLNKQVADVLTFGAEKYFKPPYHDSWKDVPDGKIRYTDGMLRHFHAYFVEGEKVDPESGKSHLAHLMCNVHFIHELDKIKDDETSDR